jgi:hypothetical protein
MSRRLPVSDTTPEKTATSHAALNALVRLLARGLARELTQGPTNHAPDPLSNEHHHDEHEGLAIPDPHERS